MWVCGFQRAKLAHFDVLSMHIHRTFAVLLPVFWSLLVAFSLNLLSKSFQGTPLFSAFWSLATDDLQTYARIITGLVSSTDKDSVM